MIVEFEALNQSGKMISDSLVVDDIDQARDELLQRNLTPVQIRPGSNFALKGGGGLLAKLKGGDSNKVANTNKASKKDLPFFTTQLAILLETGTPVAPSLGAIFKQLRSPHWKQVVEQLSKHVEEGGSLATAVQQFPKLFDPVYGSMISAGESSGRLSEILNRLAELARQSDRLRSKIISAMIYPVLLVTIAVSVLSVLIFFVLPRFATIFEEMQVTLPTSTRGLMAISAFVRNNVLLTLIGLGALVGGTVYWFKSDVGRRHVSRIILKIPIAGSLVSSIITARIFRLLGILIVSEVPLVESLDLTRTSIRHYLYADMVKRVSDSVLVGQPMHEAMAKGDLVSPSIVQIVQTGEENGQVGKVMTLLADYLDDRNETLISSLTSVMEPVILIFMGIIIGIIAISLVLPMFDLSQISG
jgi:type II secretory pathway component PulF